ncbi:MAG: response regulator transcription factor [Parashewanella sp.]
MSDIKQLIFLHEFNTPCHLAVLAASVGLKIKVVKKVSDILQATDKHESFCLIPQRGVPLDSKGVPLVAAKLIAEVPIALYQVDRGKVSEESAIRLGIHGILYADLGMDLLLTGLKKMLAGELWFDRNLLSKTLRDLVKKVEPDTDIHKSEDNIAMWQMLTTREKTIIQLVSSGARNKEIAHRLCISEHTVKAHISSIFRKTQSRNRVELLRWSNQYQAHFA